MTHDLDTAAGPRGGFANRPITQRGYLVAKARRQGTPFSLANRAASMLMPEQPGPEEKPTWTEWESRLPLRHCGPASPVLE